ncbi:hypothetical protein BN2497_5485 [Janthinobacterium sp. CG23_2]|nr:hypothetical protein BN2497_5485 [Janthinobacterium sp. CG23_2]CUU29140.1 hypothetical protein BN3177_5485 [Janthinobacterium sp. CG23_2]
MAPPDDACWQMSAEQWQWLVAGVDWQRLSAPAPGQWHLRGGELLRL